MILTVSCRQEILRHKFNIAQLSENDFADLAEVKYRRKYDENNKSDL
ncbi:MAG: hypothetical protein LBQ66_10135 [Planctomycetaceae bacterium]|nr:hypothetical protein [Planctomycetaceae bacterium]